MMPPHTISVARPTCWGNRFVVRPDLPVGAPIGSLYVAVRTPDQAVASYRQYLIDHPAIAELSRMELAGFNLGCWCGLCERHRDGKPFGEQCADCAPCHADPLGETANR
jgi:hypothetical protein